MGRPHGLDGHLGLYVEPEDVILFETGSSVFIENRIHTVRSIREADRGYHVAFEEVVSREGAEQIRNRDVMVSLRRELTDDEYWPEDLIGLTVEPGGGVVAAVEHGPAQDRLVIRRGEDTFEVPFVNELVPRVDLARGTVEVLEIEGLTGR